MEGTNTTKAWLGVATAIISILAFFGISNFEQIRQTLDPDSVQRAACKQAATADQESAKNVTSPYARRTLAMQLRQAADATKDPTLQAALRLHADAADQYANAMASKEVYKLAPSIGTQFQESRNASITYCEAHDAW